MISGAIAFFSCERTRSIDAGDHIILLGEIKDFSSTRENALGYCEGKYFSLELERETNDVENQKKPTEKTLTTGALL